jgi:hypothetical protein
MLAAPQQVPGSRVLPALHAAAPHGLTTPLLAPPVCRLLDVKGAIGRAGSNAGKAERIAAKLAPVRAQLEVAAAAVANLRDANRYRWVSLSGMMQQLMGKR